MGLLYSPLVLQCYVSSFVWMSLLFLYFHNLNCGNVLALVIIFVSRYTVRKVLADSLYVTDAATAKHYICDGKFSQIEKMVEHFVT